MALLCILLLLLCHLSYAENQLTEKNTNVESVSITILNEIEKVNHHNNNSQQDIIDIKNKLDIIFQEIDSLKKNALKNNKEKQVVEEKFRFIEKDLDEIDDILNQVEKETSLDRINFYAELRTRMDWYHFNGNDVVSLFDPTVKDYDDNIHMLGSNRLRLNMSSVYTKKLRFYSRIGILCNWNDQNYNQTPFKYLINERHSTDTTLKVERAYVDYFVDRIGFLPFSISFGRLPTTDGLSTDFRENSPRRSTFPALAYDNSGDGLGLSFELNKILPTSQSALRFMYCKRSESNNETTYKDHQYDISNVYVTTGQFETDLNPLLDRSFFLFHYINVKVGALNIYDNNSIKIPGGTMFPGFPAPVTKDATIDLEPVGSLPDSLGRVEKYTLFFQTKNLFESGFDFFMEYGMSRSSPSGTVSQFGTSLVNIDENLAALIGNIKVPLLSVGILDDMNKCPRNGQAFHCGFKYHIPLNLLNIPKIGMEYYKSSRYWVGLNFASEDPLNTLDTRGKAYSFYYIQPLNKRFSFRLGHNHIDCDHKTGFYTFYNTPVPVDWRLTNSYFILDAVF
jgi:hypothetical protein